MHRRLTDVASFEGTISIIKIRAIVASATEWSSILTSLHHGNFARVFYGLSLGGKFLTNSDAVLFAGILA